MLSTQGLSLMDPGIFQSSGNRPGFGPESQKYGDPRFEILGSADNPEQRRVLGAIFFWGPSSHVS